MSSQAQLFQKTGIFTLTYPADLRAAVEKAEVSWQAFLSLPTATKQRLHYSNGGAGAGYELKLGEGVAGDQKENFDITLAELARLRALAVEIGEPAVIAFIEDASAAIALLKPSILQFAQEIETEFCLPGFVEEVDASDVGYFIRFINYFGERSLGEETATAHVDQSGFTFHLFESAPGLQCLPYDSSEWVDMPVSSGETVIIPAMQMQRRDPRFRALAHRVIATPETVKNPRRSAVCFIQLQRTPRYDKEKGGRLQEKSAGFNYNMGEAEFNTMFK